MGNEGRELERRARGRSARSWMAFMLIGFGLAACGGGGSEPCVEGATLPCDCRVGDMCFTGAQVCASGSFGACQCAAPGSDAGLGMCSAPSDAGTDAGDAGDAGPVDGGCMDGASETRPSSSCGEETRTCTGGAWGEWVETTPGPADIQCRRGEAQFANRDGCDGQEVRWRRCGDDCRWETTVSECGGGCAGTRRTSPADQEEICVPAGRFVVGCDDPYDGVTEHEDCYPRHEVYLSAFYIDRHVVSVTRYQQCVDAGACTPLEAYDYRSDTYDPNTGRNAVYEFDDAMLPGAHLGLHEPEVWSATHEQAVAFCEWDGGRLVTGAQWERAATGVYERARWPFTDDLTQESSGDWCAYYPSPDCYYPATMGLRLVLPNSDIDTLSNIIESSIGVANLYNYYEWTSDTMAPYTPTPASGRIPVDPAIVGGDRFEMRGNIMDMSSGFFARPYGRAVRELWHRDGITYDFDGRSVTGWGDPNHAAFRCARPAEGTRETR